VNKSNKNENSILLKLFLSAARPEGSAIALDIYLEFYGRPGPIL
jgi:hypothetical protein